MNTTDTLVALARLNEIAEAHRKALQAVVDAACLVVDVAGTDPDGEDASAHLSAVGELVQAVATWRRMFEGGAPEPPQEGSG